MASLSDLKKLPELKYGIHENLYLTSLNYEGKNEVPIFTFKLIKIDPDTKAGVMEASLSMFKPDITKEYVFNSLQQLSVQLHGIITALMGNDKEKAFKVFDGIFEEVFGDVDYASFKEHKFNKKEIDKLMDLLFDKFVKEASKLSTKDNLIRAKLVMSNDGDWVQIPRKGVFTESMKVKDTSLRFSERELLNNMKSDTLNDNEQNKED